LSVDIYRAVVTTAFINKHIKPILRRRTARAQWSKASRLADHQQSSW